ncbi:MAG: DUF4743 domain-containing protein [Rhodospirillaceae bacterium]|jgi:hypothetical protein|nr:DUF4743 domain-containing protein [Rhodospirillaceae bacterium]MBT6404870.1 DUF4743 domain-containing protein [Rhodospirillaceae bacterium]MBT6536599.1 DUF4743 domain-containing protein [Rhodospirillaceae bacterium]MBT7360872.1 DUF4743 domain-containing protein [Rhodospirillaceae bacterium]
MGFYDHIVACNNHSFDGKLPFNVGGVQVGWVRRELAELMTRWGHYFKITDSEVSILENLKDVEERSRALAEAGAALVVKQALPRNRKELCPVMARFGGEVLMRIDRAWLESYGIVSYGIHVNGYVETPNGPELWIGVRSKNREVAPGKLDNMVAGGLPVSTSLAENVVKEAAEEASVPEDLALTARPAGVISYTLDTKRGMRRDLLFVYDLKLPADFEPVNTDGEVSGFVKWPAQQALRVIDETDEFKFNVNLVIIDFAIRHGLIAPEHPDYARLIRGLRAWA